LQITTYCKSAHSLKPDKIASINFRKKLYSQLEKNMQLLFALICFFIHAHLFPSFATTAETVDGYNVASRINCEDPALRLTPDINKFPIPKEKAELGPNYEVIASEETFS
jgi:hypothetical protein